jgi:hypothetical protein
VLPIARTPAVMSNSDLDAVFDDSIDEIEWELQ